MSKLISPGGKEKSEVREFSGIANKGISKASKKKKKEIKKNTVLNLSKRSRTFARMGTSLFVRKSAENRGQIILSKGYGWCDGDKRRCRRSVDGDGYL